MNLKDRAKKLKSDIPALFIALNKKETPVVAKIFAAIAIGYALSPIDFIPDFIPVEIFMQCRVEAENLWSDGKPKKWYFSIPIVLIFLIIKLVVT